MGDDVDPLDALMLGDQVEEFFENRIIKPLPDYSYNPELKELAMTI
jgi:hypothetical protein